MLNIYLHLDYENIGPLKAFNLWWSYFVLENIGEFMEQALLVTWLLKMWT